MPPAAKITITHACPAHASNPQVTGSANTWIGYLPAGRVDDKTACGAAIAEGATTVLINHMPAARLGDPTNHGGVLVSGHPNVLIGDTPQIDTLIAAAGPGVPFCEECEKARRELSASGDRSSEQGAEPDPPDESESDDSARDDPESEASGPELTDLPPSTLTQGEFEAALPAFDGIEHALSATLYDLAPGQPASFVDALRRVVDLDQITPSSLRKALGRPFSLPLKIEPAAAAAQTLANIRTTIASLHGSGMPRQPETILSKAALDKAIGALRAQLGDEVLGAVTAEGLDPDHLAQLGLQTSPGPLSASVLAVAFAARRLEYLS